MERSGYPNQRILFGEELLFRLKYKALGANNTYIDDINLMVDDQISVGEISPPDFVTVFPNPPSQKLNVRFKSPNYEMTSINLLDPVGCLVENLMTNKLKKNELTFAIDSLEKGLYLVHIKKDIKHLFTMF